MKGQKAKGSGEGGEARTNGKPGRSHRDLGLNPSPVGYKLCDLSQLLSLSEPRFPCQHAAGGDRASPASWRAEPTARQKGELRYFWVAAGDRACPRQPQASCCPRYPPPALAAPPRKERRLALLQDDPAGTRRPHPSLLRPQTHAGARQHQSQWVGCLTWLRIVQPRFSDAS